MPWDKEIYKNWAGRKSEATPIRQALNNMFKQYRLAGKFREKRLVHSWERLMGKPIATRTSNIYIKGKILFVHLTSAPLKNELSLSKNKILDIFEKEFGAGIVEDIRFL
ncbi:MAG: DUF721 domain-containing protein [Bacteroidetes bacterium]|nr:DUF721 domain-containing protein [Bacteroidota bacterium]MCH8233304.1 DUF721 domain-containing protein [Bacteroidota bacterium]